MAQRSITEYVHEQERLDADRSTWKMHQAEIADVIRPLRSEIRGYLPVEGQKRMQQVYDATAINANQNLGAGLYGSASNPADVWMMIGTDDPEFNDWPGAREYLDTISLRTLASFGPSYCNFYSEVFSLYLDLGASGTAIFYDEQKPDLSGFIEKTMAHSECVFDLGADGMADTMYRRWRMNVSQAAKMFGKDRLSTKLQDKLNSSTGSQEKYEFLHVVAPNEDFREGGVAEKAWVSIYAEVESKQRLTEPTRGYHEFPFFVPRWEVASGEKYGRGPGELALPDVRSLNVMAKANLKAGERQGDPPWGAASEGTFQAVRLRPGQITYGAISQRGDQLVKPLLEGGGVPFSLEIQKDLRQAVKDAFYFSLLQTIGRTGMTATEVMEMNEERMRMMGPYLGRIYVEFLQRLVARRFRALSRIAGVMPPPPAAMGGRPLQVQFVSPLALAQKSARASGALRAAQALTQVAEFDQSVMDNFNGDAYARIVAEGFGVPAILNDGEQRTLKRQQRLQAMQQQNMAAMAEQAAKAANSGAGAIAQLRNPAQKAA